MPHAPSTLPPARPKLCFLLAVWGASYIEQFFERSLRTLLSEGNIPALAAEGDCTFLFLTRPEDVDFFRAQPMFARLEKYCAIRFEFISDIIFPLHHSATLTTAFDRGMRSLGAAMLDTYFIYLMSDYVFSTNALRSILKPMREGYSAITAGNYQVVEEEALPELDRWIEADGIIRKSAREIIAWSMRHLHRVTVANMVTADATHSRESNRLFWRVDETTIIGRFYLRHTLCLKPETADYTIGASWDYSYLPAMCPSGNVYHFQDSDEYFVLELQPEIYEVNHIRRGPPTPENMAAAYQQWTTAEQRANAHIPVVYHAHDIPPGCCAAMLERSAAFVNAVEARMSLPPSEISPHRYWTSCARSIANMLARSENPEMKPYFPGLHGLFTHPTFGSPLRRAQVHIDRFPQYEDVLVARRFRLMKWVADCAYRLLGFPLHTNILHPYYTNLRILNQRYRALKENQSLLVVTDAYLRNWLRWNGNAQTMLRNGLIRLRDPAELTQELSQTPACWLPATMEMLPNLGAIMDALARAMPNGATIDVLVTRSAVMRTPWVTRAAVMQRFGHLATRPNIQLETLTLQGGLRFLMDLGFGRFLSRLENDTSPSMFGFLSAAMMPLITVTYTVYNALYCLMPTLGIVGSSAVIRLRVVRK